MNTRWLKARQTKYTLFLIAYIAVILTVITIANILADRHNDIYHHDFTSNKRYSLSEQTLKVVRNLKEDATITYFDDTSRFREPTGGPGSPSPKDLLDRYASISPKIHVEYVSPDKKPEIARAAGVKTYGTTIVKVGNRSEQAKSLSEEGITGALIRDIKSGTRKICFITGAGENQIDNADRSGLSSFKTLIEKETYTTDSISLLAKPEVPSDCTVLVSSGPANDYAQPEVDAIKKYVENGGRALFMLWPPLKMGRNEIADNNALTTVLAGWGVTMTKDLVLDLNPFGQLLGVGPEVVLVSNYPSHAIVKDLKGTATGFPITRSMDIKNGDKTTVEKILEAPKSTVATANLSASAVNPDDPSNKQGPFAIGAAGTYNSGKEGSNGRFVVVGSARWADNAFITFRANRDLAMNIINWLSSDEDLISIRPVEQEDRRVTMNRSQLNFVRMMSQFGLPGFVLIAGAIVFVRRRYEK